VRKIGENDGVIWHSCSLIKIQMEFKIVLSSERKQCGSDAILCHVTDIGEKLSFDTFKNLLSVPNYGIVIGKFVYHRQT